MVRLNNFSKRLEKRERDWYYRWKVFVDEPVEELARIESVEYTLHPTFPQPHQVRNNRQEKFALETSGWGEFTMMATFHFTDGSKEKVPYWLDLSKGWPEGD